MGLCLTKIRLRKGKEGRKNYKITNDEELAIHDKLIELHDKVHIQYENIYYESQLDTKVEILESMYDNVESMNNLIKRKETYITNV